MKKLQQINNEVLEKRFAFPLREISERTGMSISHLRNEEKKGRLVTRRYGAKKFVLTEDLHRYLQGNLGSGGKENKN